GGPRGPILWEDLGRVMYPDPELPGWGFEPDPLPDSRMIASIIAPVVAEMTRRTRTAICPDAAANVGTDGEQTSAESVSVPLGLEEHSGNPVILSLGEGL